MHRRTLLLFTLFVVTAWFYTSVTSEATAHAGTAHQHQTQMLSDAENGMSRGSTDPAEEDRG